MQAIARVNRTFKDKPSGLVVDYIGIADDLRSALATYTDRDKRGRAIGEDVRTSAIPEMLVEHSVVSGLLAGIDWVTTLASGDAKAYVYAVTEAVDYLLESERGRTTLTTAPKVCRASSMTVRTRARRRSSADSWRTLLGSDASTRSFQPPRRLRAIRDDVAFFDGVRQSIAKIESTDRETSGDAMDTAIRQIISQHVSGSGVIDIFAAAGLAKPDISVIDDDFLKHFEASDQKNLQLEAVRRLISNEVKIVAQA